MRNKRTSLSYMVLALVALSTIIYGCQREDEMLVPAEKVFFNKPASDNYRVTAPNVTYKIPVGLTAVPNGKSTTVNISVSSPSGAVQGTHYTLSTTSVTLTDSKLVDTIVVTGVYNQYLSGRKDTLVFTISDANSTSPGLRNTFTLYLAGPCFDGDVSDITTMGGAYANTMEGGGSYGPYTVSINQFTKTGPTTASAKISNLWDYFGPVNINFDWTDPNNTIVSIPYQQTDQDYDAGQPFMIRTSPNQVNKFSVCNNRITLTVDIIVNNYPGPGSAAYYEQNYDIILDR